MQTKPVITMATDSKEAKLDERVEVTVSEGPGKQKQSEDLWSGLLLKWQCSTLNAPKIISTVSLRTVLCFLSSKKHYCVLSACLKNDNSVNIYAPSCL